MTSSNLLQRIGKFSADNSPLLLTSVGVIGTVTTAILSAKAGLKAAIIMAEDENHHPNIEPTFRRRAELTWTLYLPAFTTGLVTVTCIVSANRIGTRRAAAIAAAYALTEKAFAEYKDKVVEKLGTLQEQRVRDEIAQERVKNNPVSEREVIITGAGEVLCYDSITGRYFQSNIETLRKAQNDVNALILESMYAPLEEFYTRIGLPVTPYSSEVGWNSDKLLDLRFSTVLSEDGRPCISVDYGLYPIRDYYRLQ